MGIRWIKMGKVSDKMRQDGAKMRHMEDVSSVLGSLGGGIIRKPPTALRAEGPGKGRDGVNPTPGTGGVRGLERSIDRIS